MAFLDNSGDIILDAVLTDLGRKRMATGNFNIAKFALGDEEINYKLWNHEDPRGSAFYDLEIMQTPLLEAFTSDQSLMKSRLLTLVDDSLLYLPIMRVNRLDRAHPSHQGRTDFGGFFLTADSKTYNLDNMQNAANAGNDLRGVIRGTRGTHAAMTTHICVDQGIDAGDSNLTIADNMSGELLERAFIVKVDHRLLVLDGYVSDNDTVPLREQFIDDDGIATYYIVDSQNRSPIMGPRDSIGERERDSINEAGRDADALNTIANHEVFSGPLGSVLRITPRASVHVARGDSLFKELGTFSDADADKINFRGGTIDKYHFIDTVISVSGATTGFSVDIPIRIIKGTSFNE